MAWVMVQFQWPGAAPSVEAVRTRFGLKPAEIDAEGGIVATDDARGLYVAQIDDRVAAKVDRKLGPKASRLAEVGVFSNPSIEPFE
jgi:hypothetical protein